MGDTKVAKPGELGNGWIFFFYEKPGPRRGGFCHFRKSVLGRSALWKETGSRGHVLGPRETEEMLPVEAAL